MPQSARLSVTITVAVASVSRPEVLRSNLQAIRAQTDAPDDLLVIAQAADAATQIVAQEFDARLVVVHHPGFAFAVESAIAASRTDVIAFVDDDAQPLPDWLSRIRAAFSGNVNLGLLGGRDNVDGDRAAGSADHRVGLMVRGMIVGNHHLGHGSLRAAVHVKGANMSMRVGPARRVPLSRLVRGEGAQARSELILSLAIIRQGFEAAYDPRVQVDHYPAARFAGDEREAFTRARTQIVRHNETVAIALYRSRTELLIYLTRAALIGDRNCYGVAFFIIRALQGERGAFERLRGSFLGFYSALTMAHTFREDAFSN